MGCSLIENNLLLWSDPAKYTRTGFEDTLTLPDGSLAESNAALVAAARRIVAKVVSP